MKNSNTTQSTVRVGDIPAIIDDPDRGIVSFVGDQGGLSQITGSVSQPGLVMGTLAFETEHGVVYLEPDEETEISEAFPPSGEHPWVVSWTVDSDAPSAEEAAAQVWRDFFGRSVAGPDDACSFTVTDAATGQSVEVDLSELSSAAVPD